MRREVEARGGRHGAECSPLVARLAAVVFFAVGGGALAGGDGLDLSDEPHAPAVEDVPARPRPLLELGERFLGGGRLGDGIRLPTGAHWRPQLVLYGTFRTALQTNEAAGIRRSEWANRLDLHANLRLSGTERVLLSLRPLNGDSVFSGYQFEPEDTEGWVEEANGRVEALFFEGELGEIFPRLDPEDRGAADVGFSIGRQPLLLQDGFLVGDTIDSLGVVRNSLRPGRAANLRVTGLVGWNDIHRPRTGVGDTVEDRTALLLAVSTALDLPSTTLELDVVHLSAHRDTGTGFFAGVGATQRLGRFSTAFRLLASLPMAEEKLSMGSGMLVVSEVSFTPHGTHDVAYVTTFGAFGDYTAVARDPAAGGALSRMGILYEAAGLGRYGSALSDEASDAAGFALGYQWIRAGGRRQVVLELAGRTDTRGGDHRETALGVRFQQALGRRMILQLDGFVAAREAAAPRHGGRCEVLVKF